MAKKDNYKLDVQMTESALQRERELPGGSNAGEYPRVDPDNFAGNACGLPGTYPINTIERARSALAYAHYAEDPDCIRRQVYKKYPSLDPEKNDE